MATRYWVGGNGNWGTGGTTANWSASSGGASGVSIPNLNDDVILDAASGTVTITVGGTAQCRSIVATTFTGTFGGSGNIQLLGGNTGTQGSGKSLEWGTGMTLSYSGVYTIGANTGSGSINFKGKIPPVGSNITFNGAAGIWSLVNDLTTLAQISIASGTFNTNNYNITAARFDITGTGTKVINLGSSIITITQTIGAGWANTSTAGLTLSGTYTIRFTGNITSSVTFIGGGATYYNVELLRGSGTGTFIIQGSNTFNSFTDATGTAAHDITFTAGTTQTFQNFNVRGASGLARVRFLAAAGTTPILVKTGSGFVYADYLNLGANVTTASPANTWYAGYNSIGTGTGWVLRNPLGLLTMGVGG